MATKTHPACTIHEDRYRRQSTDGKMLMIVYVSRSSMRRARPPSIWMSDGSSGNTCRGIARGKGLGRSWTSRTCGMACSSSSRKWGMKSERSSCSPPCPTSLSWLSEWRNTCHPLDLLSANSKEVGGVDVGYNRMPIFRYFPFFPLFLARSVLCRSVSCLPLFPCFVCMLIFSIFSNFVFIFLNFLSLFVFIFCETARTRRFSVIFAKVQWHP